MDSHKESSVNFPICVNFLYGIKTFDSLSAVSYFSDALAGALEASGYNQRRLAAAAGIAQSTISKFKSGALDCDAHQLESLVTALTGWPQHQLNLVIGRCKDLVPDQYRALFDQLEFIAEEDGAAYNPTAGQWDQTVEILRAKGRYNRHLKNTLTSLAEIAQ